MKIKEYKILDNNDFLDVVYYIYEWLTGYSIDDEKNEQHYGLEFLTDILYQGSLEEKVKMLEKVIGLWNLDEEMNPNYSIDFNKDDPDYDPRYPEDDFDLIDYILRIVNDDEIELEDLEEEEEDE